MGLMVAQWFRPLPSAQVMISGSWDGAPHQALCSAGSLLTPLSLPAYMASVCHLYVFFGEVSVHVFCPFFDMIICFVCVEFEEFFLDLGYQPFVCNVICEYLLPFHELPLCFV